MGAEIIAEKFALIKTKGSNGVSFTHIVEDTLLGRRAVVKVSDKLGTLGLDYLKSVNLAQESNISGILMPFEGGLLEEESGYYLAFPELGEPSLENYLRMGAPVTCREIVEISEQMLGILEVLHEAGFMHLFINTRNVFYRPRQGITLKDPALREDYFHFLLELVAAPDFYYFSPEVMDGMPPGAAADLYALGKLISRLLEEAVDAGVSGAEALALRLAERCCSAGGEEEDLSAADLRRELLQAKEASAGAEDSTGMQKNCDAAGCTHGNTLPASSHGPLFPHSRKNMKARRAWMTLVFLLALVLAVSIAFAYYFTGGEDGAPVLDGSGGSAAGEAKAAASFADRKMAGEEVAAGGCGVSGVVAETSKTEAAENGEVDAAGGEETHSGESEGGVSQESGHQDACADTTTADPSPAPPVASLSLSPPEGQSPLQVHLDASSSYDPDGSIVSYIWSCGGSGKSLYRVFESNVIPTTIAITLTVTDDGGHTASTTKYVTLY